MTCTCGGIAPGFPQHEDWCGKPEERVHDGGCFLADDHDGGCMTHDDVAEAKLQARDYDVWARL